LRRKKYAEPRDHGQQNEVQEPAREEDAVGAGYQQTTPGRWLGLVCRVRIIHDTRSQ